MIGFAAVSTSLLVYGTFSIGANTDEFDVYFSNAIENGIENKKLIRSDTLIKFEHDMTLKGEKYILEYDVTNGSKNYDAEVSINCLNGLSDYLEVTNEFDEDSVLLATQTRRGKLTIEVIKAYAGTKEEKEKNIEVSCEIVANAVERNELATGTPAEKKRSEWLLTVDNDNNGEVSVGDLVSFDTENFYIYDIDGENVKIISQYNLNVGNYLDSNGTLAPIVENTGLQDLKARGVIYDKYGIKEIDFNWYGMVPFMNNDTAQSTISSDYNSSSIKKYVDDYSAKLNSLGANIQNSRLITIEELEKAGCDEEMNSCKPHYSYSTAGERIPQFNGTSLSFLYSTSYWTSSINEENSRIWAVWIYGRLSQGRNDNDYAFGVRPVIELKKSQIKMQVDKDIKLCSLSNPTINIIGQKKWSDNDCSNSLSPGDLITFETESFYVYDLDDDNIKAISQYNLYIGDTFDGKNRTALDNATGLQDSRALGHVIDSEGNIVYPAVGLTLFSSSNVHGDKYNSYVGSLAERYVANYAQKLSFIEPNINSVRLITLEELERLRCDSSQKTCYSSPEYLWSTNYWTSSADLSGITIGTGDDSSIDSKRVWVLETDGTIRSSYANGLNLTGINNDGVGIRPVIEISKSLFE